MLDLCLLGTGGMMPLPYRWLTSLMLRYNGSSLLVRAASWSIRRTCWSPLKPSLPVQRRRTPC